MKKKITALGAALLSAAVVLGGCSSNTSDDTSPAGSNASSTASAAAAGTDEVTLYVVRHGKTMLNTTDRVQGWADAPLTPAGEEVVEDAGRGSG